MADDSQMNLVLEMLRRQQESVDKLEEAVSQGHQRSAESRAKLYERLDDVASHLGKLDTDIAILGHVDAQVRNELDGLKTSVQEHKAELQPTLDDWKRMKAISLGLVGLLTIGGASVGAMAVWAGESLVNTIRAWLRIG